MTSKNDHFSLKICSKLPIIPLIITLNSKLIPKFSQNENSAKVTIFNLKLTRNDHFWFTIHQNCLLVQNWTRLTVFDWKFTQTDHFRFNIHLQWPFSMQNFSNLIIFKWTLPFQVNRIKNERFLFKICQNRIFRIQNSTKWPFFCWKLTRIGEFLLKIHPKWSFSIPNSVI